MTTLTYDDVMFDWAVAELFSPSWGALWTFPRHDTLRQKIKSGGESACSIYEKTYLIERLREFRAPVIGLHGPHRSCRFSRVTVPRTELADFAILASFNAPGHCLGALAKEVRADPSAHEALHESATEIAAHVKAGGKLYGTPIAIAREAPWHPILLAGYKRCVAHLWDADAGPLDVHLCG